MRVTGKAALFWFLCAGVLGFGVLAGLDGAGVMALDEDHPSHFFCRHPAFVNLVGSKDFTPWFFVTEKGGDTYSGLSYEWIGTGSGTVYFSDHAGKSFMAEAWIGVLPDWYGGSYYYETDYTDRGQKAKGKLSVKTDTEYFPLYGRSATYPIVQLSTKLKLSRGTQLSIQAFSLPYFYSYYAPLALDYMATWGKKNVLKGGIVPASFQGLKQVRFWARLPVATNQALSMNVDWVGPGVGTVLFLSPPFLATATGTVKLGKKGDWSIKADKPHKAKMKLYPDGSGLVDLGYGKIELPPGSVDIDYK